jgi:hypothetical protein
MLDVACMAPSLVPFDVRLGYLVLMTDVPVHYPRRTRASSSPGDHACVQRLAEGT